jgi:hypothetical protein
MTDLLPVEGMVLGVLAEGGDAVEDASWGIRLEYLHWSPLGCSPVHHLSKMPNYLGVWHFAKIENKTKVFAPSEGSCRNTKNRFAPKKYHLTQAELGTSDRIPISDIPIAIGLSIIYQISD